MHIIGNIYCHRAPPYGRREGGSSAPETSCDNNNNNIYESYLLSKLCVERKVVKYLSWLPWILTMKMLLMMLMTN